MNGFGRLAATIVSRPSLVGAVLLAVVLAVTAGIGNLSAEFDVRLFYDHSDDELPYLQQYQERWGEDLRLVLVIDGQGESVLTRPRLKAMEGLMQRLAEDPAVNGVIGPPNMPRPGRNRLMGMSVPDPLLATVPKDEAKLADWQAQLLDDPSLVPTFVSNDGTLATVLVSLSGFEMEDISQVRPVVKRLEAMIANPPIGEALTVNVTGVPAIRGGLFDAMFADQVFMVPLAALVAFLVLVWMFRSRRGTLIPSVAAAVPTFMLFGLMGYTGEGVNMLNQTFLVLVPVIAVADAIHLMSRYEEELAAGTETDAIERRRQAIIRTLSAMGAACLLTSVTTFVGFLSLSSANMPVIKHYGFYAATGVALSYLTVIFILPLALVFTRPEEVGGEPGGKNTDRLLGRVGTWAVTRPWAVLAATGLVTLAFLYMGTWVQVDTRVSDTLGRDHPSTVAGKLVDERLGGLMLVEYELVGEPGAFLKPDVLDAVKVADAHLATHPAVRQVWSAAGLVGHTALLLGVGRGIPQSESAVKQLIKNAEEHGNPGFMNGDRSRSRILVRVQDNGGRAFERMVADMSPGVQTALDPVGVTAHATGSAYVAYRGLRKVSSDLRKSLMWAFMGIAVIIGLLFRSVWIGGLSLIPNIVPLVVGYGTMGLFGVPLSEAPAVAFTVALGLCVDNTIHVLARFREELNRHSRRSAVVLAVRHSGRAVTVSALILAAGFGINSQSRFTGNATFGWLGAEIIVVALLANVLALPALLMVIRGKAAVGVGGKG